MAQSVKLKSSLKAHKGHFTRLLNGADNLLHLVDDGPTPILAGKLEDTLDQLYTRFNTIQEVIAELQGIDDTNFDAYEKDLDNINGRLQHAVKDIIAGLKICHDAQIAPLQQLQQQPQPILGRIKTNDALKPFILRRDNNPVEFRQWILQFKAFYNTSRLDTLDIPDQHAYLRICMDSNLYERFQRRLGATTPIFSQDGDCCISFLEEEFAIEYPLFTRRLDFFRSIQQTNQPFSEFIAKLDAKADEADLENIDTQELFVFRYICACTDDKLKEKLLKLEHPTRDEIKRTTRAYEVAQISLKAFDEPTSTNAKAFATNKKKFRQRKQSSQKRKTSNLPDSFKNKCLCCAKKGHQTKDCKIRHLTCQYCNKKGHIKPACLKQYYDKKTSQPGTANTSRGGSPSPTSPDSNAHLNRVVSKPTPRINTDFKVGQKLFSFLALPDTGATRTIISSSILNKYSIPFQSQDSEKLFAANGQQMATEGTLSILARIKPRDYIEINALVSPDLKDDILLSWHDLQALRVIS